MAILDVLNWIGESLDKPGAAARGLLAGRPDQLANLIPFSDTLGITNPQDRTYGRDLLQEWGMLGENTPGLDIGDVAGFGVDLLTDPLNWLGGLAAKSLGAAALRRGPRYPGGMEKIWNAIPDGSVENFTRNYAMNLYPARPGENLSPIMQRLVKRDAMPELDDVLSEIPENSTFLGHGSEGFALKTPQGDALRIDSPLFRSGPPRLRPDIPGMLQPTRAVRYGDHIVERLPLAEVPTEGLQYQNMMTQFINQLEQSGIEPRDMTPGNVGLVGGSPVAIDPTSLKAPMREIPDQMRSAPVMDSILDHLGYTDWARRNIEGGSRLNPSPLLKILAGYNTAVSPHRMGGQ